MANGGGGGGSRGPVISLAVIVFTGIVTYSFGLISESRKRKVDFVNSQIEKVYGPLYSLSVANEKVSRALFSKYQPDTNAWFKGDEPSPPEHVEIWRRWMKTVFMPTNLKMEEIIVNNSQLLEGGHIYPVFERFILHVESYKAVIAKWKDSDDLRGDPNLRKAGENTSLLNYPETLDGCISKTYEALLLRRGELERSWTGMGVSTGDTDQSRLPAECR